MHWFIDFDDTLAVGPMTWAFKNVIPKLIEDHKLPYEPDLFADMALRSQQQANEGLGDDVVFDNFLQSVNWPSSVKQPLIEQIFSGYRPALFEDAKPFLDRLRAQGQTLYIVSNNNKADKLAQMLGVADYFAGIYTPKSCGVKVGKPQRDMMDFVVTQHALASDVQIAMVGDDPWSDGSFADTCKLQCWLLDRMDRYAKLYPDKQYRWVRSLDEITITEGAQG